MIAYIKGTAVYADEECIVVDNRGMGYEVRTSSATCNQVRTGDEVTLYTYLYVREDMLALYGFFVKRGAEGIQAPSGSQRNRSEGGGFCAVDFERGRFVLRSDQ